MNICILSDSYDELKALDSFQINSKLVWSYLQSLITLAELNQIQMIWMPEHKETVHCRFVGKTGGRASFVGLKVSLVEL